VRTGEWRKGLRVETPFPLVPYCRRVLIGW
jgi:hypothetical protein